QRDLDAIRRVREHSLAAPPRIVEVIARRRWLSTTQFVGGRDNRDTAPPDRIRSGIAAQLRQSCHVDAGHGASKFAADDAARCGAGSARRASTAASWSPVAVRIRSAVSRWPPDICRARNPASTAPRLVSSRNADGYIGSPTCQPLVPALSEWTYLPAWSPSRSA